MPSPSPNSLATIDWLPVLGDQSFDINVDERQQLSQSLFKHSPRCVRLSAKRSPLDLPFETKCVPWHDRGYWLTATDLRPGSFLQYPAGDYYIQDAASMLALTLCDARPGEVVCDLCAAPGGKATGLLDQLAGKGFLLANEVIQNRLPLLQFALSRSGWANHATSNLDSQQLACQLPAFFDCVLVDAPCSGQSMVSRDKQSLAAFSPPQIEHNAARQRRIIRQAGQLVKPGGRLVYSTCTFSVAENEDIVEEFIREHSVWSIQPKPELSQWSSPRLPGTYRLWPHRDSCDGGFAACIRKSMDAEFCELPTLARQKSLAQMWTGRLSELEFLTTSLDAKDAQLLQIRDEIHAFENLPSTNLLAISKSGVAVGQLLSGRCEPLYGCAVAELSGVHPKQSIHLNNQQAASFIRGESLRIDQPLTREHSSQGSSEDLAADQRTGCQGWVQVCWNDRPLAWGKLSGQTLKNHLPKLLRNPSIGLA